MTTPRRLRGAALALAALALTGCGAVRPGVAVEVGEETISTARVDEVAADFCRAVEPQLEGQAQTIPNGYFRGGIAGTLAMRAVADQVAEQYGVEADTDQYEQQVAQSRRDTAGLPDDIRENVLEVDTAPAYVEAVQARVGEQLLDGDGEYADFVEAGADAFTRWMANHDIEFDPSLNTAIADGTVKAADDSLSFAVSPEAKEGAAEQPDSVTARLLPAAHTCGRD